MSGNRLNLIMLGIGVAGLYFTYKTYQAANGLAASQASNNGSVLSWLGL